MHSLIKEKFPHFLLIKASAGTGKTFALSKRIVSFLLSDHIPNNQLRNILAITFTVNATKEMKERVLEWLKRLYFVDKNLIKHLEIQEEDLQQLIEKSDRLIETIFADYKDFQIKTIDSFLASVFKASSIDFGYNDSFQVLMNNKEVLKTCFDRFIVSVSEQDRDFFRVVDFINDQDKSFDFFITDKIFRNIRELYIRQRHFKEELKADSYRNDWHDLTVHIKTLIWDLKSLIESSSIKINKNCSLNRMFELIKDDNFQLIFECGIKTPPLKKEDLKNKLAPEINKKWEKLVEFIKKGLELSSERYFAPYISVMKKFEKLISDEKLKENVVFIEDIPWILYKHISADLIPDIYLRLGGRLYHFFIDEFQDTSEIQWLNLRTLIENSLAQRGSLFIVGDTKQAIYGFRDTDYRIMKGLIEKNPFHSTKDAAKVESLIENHRSCEYIIDYVKSLFNRLSEKEEYSYLSDSGLFDWDASFGERLKGKGYVSAEILSAKEDQTEEEQTSQIKEKLKLYIEDIIKRNFRFSDICILAHKNDEVTEISAWLKELNYPFISFSSLDIRSRKIINEIFYLINFFDSPMDSFSFAAFLKGSIFEKAIGISVDSFLMQNRGNEPLYKIFENSYANIWKMFFDEPFRLAGYLPLYDFLCLIIKSFSIHENFPDEAGALAKLLEIIKDLESKGKNSLKEFLDFIKSQDDEEYESGRVFELPIPKNFNGINVMTVHKAKGLGFPVVVYVAREFRRLRDSFKIWQDNDSFKILKLNRSWAEKSEKLGQIYKSIEAKEKINDLNSLYVALTRAKKELYIIGFSDKEKDFKFPLDVIITGKFGEKLEADDSKINENIDLENVVKLTFSPESLISEAQPAELAFEERKRGDFIHLLLSRLDELVYLDKSSLVSFIEKYRVFYPSANVEKIFKELQDFFSDHKIMALINPGGNRLIEKEFSDKEGNVLRPDRIVFKDDRIIVIDFKTGDKEASYEKQIQRYARVLKDIYSDRIIECYLIYFDLRETEKVYEI